MHKSMGPPDTESTSQMKNSGLTPAYEFTTWIKTEILGGITPDKMAIVP